MTVNKGKQRAATVYQWTSCQAIDKVINALYCDNNILRHALYDNMFQRIKPLPFVPVDDFSYAWEVLKPTIPSDVADFTQYYESTRIGTGNSSQSCQVRSSMLESALLCPSDIIQHSRRLHLGLKSFVKCTNPNLWTFLDALIKLSKDSLTRRLLMRVAI